MIAALLALALPAQAYDPVTFECVQTNPYQYSDFTLTFVADMDTERPVAARLYDNETASVRMQGRKLPAMPKYWDTPGMDTYGIGRDGNGTDYMLRVPQDPWTDPVDVEVLQVFGGGQAQWVNEFTCEAR